MCHVSNRLLAHLVLAVILGLLTGCAGLPVAGPGEATEAAREDGAEPPLPPLQTEGLRSDEINAVEIYRTRSRAVVHIAAAGLRSGAEEGSLVPSAGVGSGFIIDQEGTVVTNHHVIRGAQRMLVTLYDGSRYRAEPVGSDPELDLAVIRFNPRGRSLATIPGGDSSGLQVGQQVFALGNPFGLDGSLTTGVVSALNRPMRTSSGYVVRELIQSDAAINPGNSGGPLLNSRGQLIGVNSMIISPSRGSVGIGLSIPYETVQRVVAHILEEGPMVRGWIDIEAIGIEPRLALDGGLPVSQGVLVTRVLDEGNAAIAGLQDGRDGRTIRHGPYRIPVQGDIITAVNDQPVENVGQLLARLEGTRPRETIQLTIVRDGGTENLSIRLSRQPDTPRPGA